MRIFGKVFLCSCVVMGCFVAPVLHANIVSKSYVDIIVEALEVHKTDTNNPHAVTATQVGLGNVKNVDNTNADNIKSGVLAYERLPIGTVANTVAAGDDARFFGVPRTKPDVEAPDGMVWMWFE